MHAVTLSADGIGTIPPDNTHADLNAAVDYYSKYQLRHQIHLLYIYVKKQQ